MLSFLGRSIAAKVAGAAALLVTCSLVLGVAAFVLLGEGNRRLGDMYDQEVNGLETADDIKAALYRIRSDSLEYVLAERDETRARFREEINAQQARVDERVSQLRTAGLDAQEAQLVDAVETTSRRYVDILEDRLFAAIAGGDEEAAETIARTEAAEVFRDAREAANAFMDYAVQRAARRMTNAEADQRTASTIIGALILLSIAIGAGAVWCLHRDVARPMVRIAAGLKRLVEKDWSAEIAGVERADEIGQIARAAGEFRRTGMELDSKEEDSRAAKVRAEAERNEMRAVADRFEQAVAGVIGEVAGAAERLLKEAGSMSDMAEGNSEKAISVSSAAEQASANVQSVAGAAEEFSATLREVVQQVRASADQTREALSLSRSSRTSMTELSEAIENIAGVTALIAEIAEKTNLLALNATIESARAGEAGKGFAVVASEVKQLAAQTAKATNDIASRIAEIKASSTGTRQSVAAIADFIENIQQNSEAISAATEEQQATIDDISRNVTEAATGAKQVSQGAHGFRETADDARRSSDELNGAAERLSGHARTLKGEIESFLKQVRAA